MTTQVPASLAPFPWAARLQSRLGSRPLAAARRQALERSLRAQSITVAVRSLTSSVGYAAMPCPEEVGRLHVHPRAGVVTTPGGFRVSFREGQALLQGPDGLWTELKAEPPTRHAAARPPLTEQSTQVLLSDGTRLTLQHRESYSPHRVLIAHGKQHLAADSTLSEPVWQPVERSPRRMRWEPQQDDARYKAMIDDGPPPESAPMNHEPTREELYALAAQGHSLYEAGEIDSARRVFESLTALDPNDSFFHTTLGAVFQHQGDLERAIAEYNQALALNERDIAARCNRAEVLLEQGQTEAAIQDLERISELDPNAQCSHTLRARNIALTLLTMVKGRG